MSYLLSRRLGLPLLRSQLNNSCPLRTSETCLRLNLPCARSIYTRSRGNLSPSPIVLQQKIRPSRPVRRIQASFSPYLILLFLVGGTAVIVEYVTTPPAKYEPEVKAKYTEDETITVPGEETYSKDDIAELFAAMSIPPGFLGNLNTEQEEKLKEFWALVLKTFGVKDPIGSTSASSARPVTPANTPVPTAEPASAKKEKHGLFHRKHKESVDSSGSTSPGYGSKQDPEDKYGQTKELQEILAASSPASLRDAFWAMVKKDHPDTLLLRFLRARKWDLQRALAMLISTMHWRMNEMHVDDDIMLNGEGGALKDSQSSDPTMKKEGADFLVQMRIGKSFIHGIDKDGRPISIVRVRLHKGGEQSEKALERYTVYTIETCRLVLQPPVETATIVFDMTDFSMANMDYTPVKFMIKVFEANYPESLGCVLVHKAPWIFQGIYKIIKGWLDPVVAAKVHFTNSPDDLQQYIPRSQIISELGGDEKWDYKYVEPTPEENVLLEDVSTRKELETYRKKEVESYEQKTFEWVHGGGQNSKGERDAIAKTLKENYWQLDPYIRARSLYDRTGMIQKGGAVDFYPSRTAAANNNRASVNGVPSARQEASADDVD